MKKRRSRVYDGRAAEAGCLRRDRQVRPEFSIGLLIPSESLPRRQAGDLASLKVAS